MLLQFLYTKDNKKIVTGYRIFVLTGGHVNIAGINIVPRQEVPVLPIAMCRIARCHVNIASVDLVLSIEVPVLAECTWRIARCHVNIASVDLLPRIEVPLMATCHIKNCPVPHEYCQR
jgi:hypothetical protein